MSATSPPAPALAGEWIGRYPGHFDEIVRIELIDNCYEAIKETGDDHVPAGEVTWRADIGTLIGEGQVADHDFHHPRFIPGRLDIFHPDLIIFHWANVGSVEFRRDS